MKLQPERVERRPNLGITKSLFVMFALCAASAVYGDETAMYEFRPAGQTGLEVKSQDAHVFDKIDLGNAGRFVSIVGYLAGIGEKGLKRVADSFYAEAMELALKGSDDMDGALALWKDNLDDSRKMGKVKDTMGKIGLAITITDGIIKIKNAKTEDELVTEACRLALHLFSTALGTLTEKPQLGDLISDLGDHALDHPEDNGFALLVNWIYDHSSLPETLSEWWWDVRYKDKILVKKGDNDPNDPEAPFEVMPENNRGNNDGKDPSRYQGLKPLRLID